MEMYSTVVDIDLHAFCTLRGGGAHAGHTEAEQPLKSYQHVGRRRACRHTGRLTSNAKVR